MYEIVLQEHRKVDDICKCKLVDVILSEDLSYNCCVPFSLMQQTHTNMDLVLLKIEQCT